LYFISHLVGGNYSIHQLSDPIHRNSDKIKCLSLIRENIFLLGLHGCPDLVIFDRLQRKDILKVQNVSDSGAYVSIKQIFPKGQELRWHLFVIKDQDKVSLVAIDLERRTLQDLELAQIKGAWCQRDCLEVTWEERDLNRGGRKHYLRIISIANP
jgi:hypothetical protein